MFVYKKHRVGIELFSHVKAFFSSKQFAELLTTWLKTIYRDLTIRQRRRPWKDQWKIDSASFQTISRFSEVVLLLKRRGFRLELKRGGSAQVQTEMVECIALPFSSSKKLKIWSFHVAVVQRWQRIVQKSVARMYRILCYCNYLLIFFSQNNDLLIAENASLLSHLFTSIYSKKHLNKIALYAKNIRYGANAQRKKFKYPP